ncbi:MAG TPA: hypothetical protein VF361_01640 [Candidatus Limnocylindrales bacterium]|jgi:hypothetical protein
MDTALIATGAILVIGAGVVFALSVWVGMLLGRRMDRALVARQAAEGPLASDQAPNVGEEVRVDE